MALQHHVFHLSLEALVLGMYMAVGIVMRFCQKYSHALNCQATGTGTGPGPGIGYWDWGWESGIGNWEWEMGKWKMEMGKWEIESTPSPRR